jgi:AcrR family transcriptional regulator
MLIKHRAIRDEQKQWRRARLIDAARELFLKHPYSDILMETVARHANVAKGTVYLYFSSKEALFLALSTEEFTTFFDSLDDAFAAMPGDAPPETLVEGFCKVLRAQPVLVKLLSLLPGVLEHNVSLEEALAFKDLLRRRALRTGALIESRLRFLRAGDGARLLARAHALLVGFRQASEVSPVMEAVYARPGMEIFRIDFYRDFAEILTVLLEGLAARALRGVAQTDKRGDPPPRSRATTRRLAPVSSGRRVE